MDIQVLSDLHLEIERGDKPLYTFDFPVCAPNLALLGDIGWTRDDRLFEWLDLQLTRFERVFFVLGNHEPYASSLVDSVTALETFEGKSSISRAEDKSRGEFIFLNRRRYDIGSDITILGCTLWSALNPADLDILSWSLTDFKRIENFNPVKYQAAHETDFNWLSTTMEEIRDGGDSRRVVVFTHHAPTIDDTGDPKFLDGPTNSAFATELTESPLWNSPLFLWGFGHTHWSCDFERGGVRVVSNQRGYGYSSKGFDERKVISV